MRALFVGLGLSLLLGLGACEKPAAPVPFNNVDITGATYAKDFSLTDHTGAKRSLADYRGKVVTVFFGFTQCPDVCPTTLNDMVEVKKRLGPQGDRLQVLFITVDPERDTQEVLAKYMALFDPSFVALYGTPEDVKTLAKDYKIVVQKVPGATPTSYTINHSTGTYVYDPQGQVRLFVPHAAGVDSVVGDVQRLLR